MSVRAARSADVEKVEAVPDGDRDELVQWPMGAAHGIARFGGGTGRGLGTGRCGKNRAEREGPLRGGVRLVGRDARPRTAQVP